MPTVAKYAEAISRCGISRDAFMGDIGGFAKKSATFSDVLVSSTEGFAKSAAFRGPDAAASFHDTLIAA